MNLRCTYINKYIWICIAKIRICRSCIYISSTIYPNNRFLTFGGYNKASNVRATIGIHVSVSKLSYIDSNRPCLSQSPGYFNSICSHCQHSPNIQICSAETDVNNQHAMKHLVRAYYILLLPAHSIIQIDLFVLDEKHNGVLCNYWQLKY